MKKPERGPSAAKARDDRATTTIRKHSLLIAGHQTSVSLEAAFWVALKAEAADRALSVAAVVAEIDAARGVANLSSAIRVHLFEARCGASFPAEAAQ